ncbi:MAG: metallophosphoesterase family protein [Mangrovibacterium sp.]
MKKIGLLSDTHGMLSPRVLRFFESVDELWHAGDIGTAEMADELASFKPLRAVYGNIDGHELRRMFSEVLRFDCEQVDVLMTHIGGYPGKYDSKVRKYLAEAPPKLFITGHSHILKVMFDKRLNLLHINPGAAGNKGYHNVCTAIRFEIDGADIRNLEVLEFERTKFHSLE